LQFIAAIYKVSKTRIDDVILATGLMPEVSKKIGNLSKGYKQRVGLAQAILHEPEVLLLDEPTTGLDPNQLKDIRALIKKIAKEEGKTILFSTHILQEVEAICDRVILINKGKIEFDDSLKNGLKGKNIELLFTQHTTDK
jgi:ABC-2 type transport system ATP-binding protein